MTIVAYSSQPPSDTAKALRKIRMYRVFQAVWTSPQEGEVGGITPCALGRWGKERNNGLKTKMKYSQPVGIYEEIYFLIARIINHNCADVCQEENGWEHRKEKEPFPPVEEEGGDRERGEETRGSTKGHS